MNMLLLWSSLLLWATILVAAEKWCEQKYLGSMNGHPQAPATAILVHTAQSPAVWLRLRSGQMQIL